MYLKMKKLGSGPLHFRCPSSTPISWVLSKVLDPHAPANNNSGRNNGVFGAVVFRASSEVGAVFKR